MRRLGEVWETQLQLTGGRRFETIIDFKLAQTAQLLAKVDKRDTRTDKQDRNVVASLDCEQQFSTS